MKIAELQGAEQANKARIKCLNLLFMFGASMSYKWLGMLLCCGLVFSDIAIGQSETFDDVTLDRAGSVRRFSGLIPMAIRPNFSGFGQEAPEPAWISMVRA